MTRPAPALADDLGWSWLPPWKMCQTCHAPLAEHWRGRPCLAAPRAIYALLLAGTLAGCAPSPADSFLSGFVAFPIAAALAVYPFMLASDWRKLRQGRFNSAPRWMRRLNHWLVAPHWPPPV